MKVLIVVNAYIKNKSQLSQAERIGEELTARGAQAEIKRNFDLARIRNGKTEAEKYDFCVFLDKDRAAARLLEKSGLRLFNSAEAIEVCDDKMLTHAALANRGIPMPDCVYAPLCYDAEALPDARFLSGVSSRLGFPLVAKTCFGSLGAGVTLIKDGEALYRYEQSRLLIAHFYQQMIGSGGEDVRVIVVGGKYLCAMKRQNRNDFRSNIEQGGTGSPFAADDRLISLCERTASILSLDYCGIDVLTDGEGRRYVCEVNSNAFFAAAEKVCGVNVAAAYARYMLQSV